MKSPEETMDQKLNIRTVGRDDSSEDDNHHAYEPTPYTVLERLVESGYLTVDTHLLDYGCGKGRVGFYLAWKTGCHSVGIEYNPEFYQAAIQNRETFPYKEKTEFVLQDAERYPVASDDTDCYFFNPFSVKILKAVIGRIKESWYEKPRQIRLFFYYPDAEYMGYLMTEAALEFVDEIDCGDLFVGDDQRECIMIFEMT